MMKDTTSPSDEVITMHISAIHKRRWVSVAIRYDEFSRFVLTFILPFRKHLLDKYLIAYFYHRKGSDNNVIQLNFVTTPFHLHREVKPFLIDMLNSYFGKDILQLNYGFDSIDITMCEHKLGLDGIDLQNLKLFSAEDLYTSPITYSIGVQGGKALSQLLSVSSGILLNEVTLNGNVFQDHDCIERSITFNLIFLYYFVPDKNIQYQFLSWVFESMLSKLDNSKDVLRELEVSYHEQKDQLTSYVDYIEDSLASTETFDDDWINTWREACSRYKFLVGDLSDSGKLTMPYDVKDNPTIRYTIDNKTYQDWQIAYFMVSSINGQMNIDFNSELNVLFWLKMIFRELYVNG